MYELMYSVVDGNMATFPVTQDHLVNEEHILLPNNIPFKGTLLCDER